MFTHTQTASHDLDECQKCGQEFTHRRGDPARRAALQKHECPPKGDAA